MQAAVLLCSLPPDRNVPIKDISKKLNISSSVLERALQPLLKAGIVTSRRGSNGGFRLASSPELFTLQDIFESFNGLQEYDSCVLGFEKCANNNQCPFHDTWAEPKAKIIQGMFSLPLSTLSAVMKQRIPNIVVEKCIFNKETITIQFSPLS